MKHTYKVIIIVVIAILVALGIYLAWRQIAAPEETGTNGGAPTEIQETVGTTNGVITKISENKVFDFWVVSATNEVYYFLPDGKISLAKDGPDLETSKQVVNALNFIEVAPGGRKILAAFGDPLAPQWGIFDVVDKVWRPLPGELQNLKR